jgi:hypothetical protein
MVKACCESGICAVTVQELLQGDILLCGHRNMILLYTLSFDMFLIGVAIREVGFARMQLYHVKAGVMYASGRNTPYQGKWEDFLERQTLCALS